jgi:hypothetical protein
MRFLSRCRTRCGSSVVDNGARPRPVRAIIWQHLSTSRENTFASRKPHNRSRTFEDAADVKAGLAVLVDGAGAIAHQTALGGEIASIVDRRHGLACGQGDETRALPVEERVVRECSDRARGRRHRRRSWTVRPADHPD